MKKKQYRVFNYTDGIFASDAIFPGLKEAKEFIQSFRDRFKVQGYYKTAYSERISLNEIDLVAIPADFNPYQK